MISPSFALSQHCRSLAEPVKCQPAELEQSARGLRTPQSGSYGASRRFCSNCREFRPAAMPRINPRDLNLPGQGTKAVYFLVPGRRLRSRVPISVQHTQVAVSDGGDSLRHFVYVKLTLGLRARRQHHQTYVIPHVFQPYGS